MKTLAASAFLAAAALAASPAFSAGAKSLPGDPPPLPSESGDAVREPAMTNSIGSEVTDDLYSMMLAYQKVMNKQAREDRKIRRQEVELALKALERDRNALNEKPGSKELKRALADLQSKTMTAAVTAVPETAGLRDKAVKDVEKRIENGFSRAEFQSALDEMKAEENSLSKAIAAAGALPAGRRVGALDAARARAESDRARAREMVDVLRDQKEKSKDQIESAVRLQKEFQKDAGLTRLGNR